MEEKFIIANGCALRIGDTRREEDGEKPVLLLIHGYLESMDVWSDFLYLLRDFRVVAFDVPGHGISQIVDTVHSMEFLSATAFGVLDQLGIDKATVVGHSMGGYIACQMAKDAPKRLSGLVLLHSTPNADTPERREHRAREIEIVESGKKELLAKINPEKSFAAENKKRLREYVVALGEQVTLTEDEGICALLRGMSQRSEYNEVLQKSDIPQLFIFGKGDEYIPVEAAEKVAESHPQASVAWMEHSGHISFLEEPEECAKAIKEKFL